MPSIAQGTNKLAGRWAPSLFHLKFMIKIDPKKQYFIRILFDGASNVQKAGQCMSQHYRRVEVNHGAEHVVA